MSETRTQLTETQFRALMNAQLRYQEAAEIANEARENLTQVRTLVLDAHSIPVESAVSIDPKTQELVIEEVEEPTE